MKEDRHSDSVPRGFTAGAAKAGVKTGVADRLDVGLIVSDRPCVAAGVFTTNQVIAAPCVITRKHLEGGTLRAIVANSGIANACTGEEGDRNAVAMARAAADAVGCSPEEIGVASTGVIGWQLPIDRITKAVGEIRPTALGFPDFARAIMTTDTKPKQIVAVASSGEHSGALRAIVTAKGAGMIHPNMATLLTFIVTDADIPLGALRPMVRRIADRSFNAISVDGDTSTNDTLLVLANGASGVAATEGTLREAEAFLSDLAQRVAREIVADGEGVTKVFAVHVSGAATDEDARRAARTITTSNLVKTAIHGADPNWGRIIAAAGRSGAKVDDRRASIRIGGIDVFREGTPVPFDPADLRKAFEAKDIDIELRLGLGEGSAIAWGTDLSAEYVHINADYTT
ncbi:MAG TPA: bifunctional glutamate N-acetyltransferase/amino-acid acetyltransferase ArgJ [Candidatus Limnocylindria bacterium]|nr:bifunctional glutamate N-acetyltransferase/amino-acid acetyltransferase ArgJ [Candidatus Limnocylindria bacterium]